MKKMSIKLRITLWFTVFMLLLSATVFVLISLISTSTAMNHTRGFLTALVESNMGEVEYDDGEIDVDDDFISFRNGIYSIVLDENGRRHYGYVPYAELENIPLVDDVVRSVDVGNEAYLVYDRVVTQRNRPYIWVRGVVSESGGSVDTAAIYRAVIIALPILILLASVGGYILAYSSLRPINKIRKTAEEISKSGDLSKRIELGHNKNELYLLAETFNRMYERLEKNFEAERSFTSDASHELRTPITTILAQCEYAFENAKGEKELYEVIGSVQKQGYRIRRLIESLLQFTRMEQQTEKVDFETIDLSGIVLSVCDEQEKTNNKNISLSTEVQPNIKMKAEMALITRLLDNLIRNAYKYGRENGNTKVALAKSGDKITLSVSDDGIGINSDELTKIWNRFYRADKSRNSATGGFGLGLAMVKQIAELHGGKVEVSSEPGKGSTFMIIFINETKN